MVIGIVGLGLIGGSIALALRKNGFANRLIGIDTSKENQALAIELGLVDEIGSLKESISLLDVVIVATPVKVALTVSSQVLDLFGKQQRRDQVLIDVGSTKQKICSHLANHPHRKQFVATHPIAGTEHSGPKAAFLDLMFDKIVIICDQKKSSSQALQTTERLFKSMFMTLHYMDAVAHDRHIAYVSHLSHITSFALGLTVLQVEKDEENIFTMAGSGFASTARLAKSSSSMWEPIFEQNKENIINTLNTYTTTLEKFKKAIEESDKEALIALMNNANQIRKVLNPEKKS